MKKTLLLFCLLAAVVCTGCKEDNPGDRHIRISPTIRTRVTGVHFDTGDCIGLTIARTSGVYASNACLAYDGTAFSEENLCWYSDRNEKSTLTAYYPYAQEGMPGEFSVAADQRNGCEESDLLGAFRSEVTPAESAVGMLFHHLLSQLSIVVTNKTDVSVTEIVISGTIPAAEVDISLLRAEAKSGAEPADIRAHAVTAGTYYEVVLVPQRADISVAVHTSDGKSHVKTVKSAQMESGARYDLSVELKDETIDVSLEGDVKDWIEGGELGGGNDGGESGTLIYQNESYRTKKIDGRLWMAENLRYIPDAGKIGDGVWYPCKNSVENTDIAFIRSQGMFYSYAVATAGASTTLDGTVRGICPEGWHIPSAEELQSLQENIGNDDQFICYTGFWNARMFEYGSELKSYLMGASVNDSGWPFCLMFQQGTGKPMSMVNFPNENGISLRCVKDA